MNMSKFIVIYDTFDVYVNSVLVSQNALPRQGFRKVAHWEYNGNIAVKYSVPPGIEVLVVHRPSMTKVYY